MAVSPIFFFFGGLSNAESSSCFVTDINDKSEKIVARKA